MDEGLIGYVDGGYRGPTDQNGLAPLNVIANPTFTLSGQEIDATEIPTDAAQTQLHEADGVEANLATGDHAIEVLLWVQDLTGHGDGTGARPWTGFARGAPPPAPAAIATVGWITFRRQATCWFTTCNG